MERVEHIDQMGRKVLLPKVPLRIVSIVPSQTELLVDLGLKSKLVGITKFCVHPGYLKAEITQIGGTKKLNFEKIRALKPDLIIGNKEENFYDDIVQLEKEFPVWMSDIFTLEDSFDFIHSIAEILDVEEEADSLISIIQKRFTSLRESVIKLPQKTAYYLIWNKPTMIAGSNTFIDDMLQRLNLVNLAPADRYPEIVWDELEEQPDVVLLSSEPFPFKEKHCEELRKRFPTATVMLVDGEYFSWYGSRLLGTPNYFKEVLHQIHPSIPS